MCGSASYCLECGESVNIHQASRHFLCRRSCRSRFALDLGQCPTPALALRRPGVFPDLFLHSRSHLGLDLCRLPSPAQDLAPVPSSRPDPIQDGLCPCVASIRALDWSVLLCLCQSSRLGPVVGLCLEPRIQAPGPCWSSSSGHEAGTGPGWTRGLEPRHLSPPVLEAVLLWVEPWSLGLTHWLDHPMT